MEPDNITSGLSQSLCHSLGICMIRKTAGSVKYNTPEFSGGAILKPESISIDLTEAVLSRGLFIFESKGNINRHTVRIPIGRNITRHRNDLLSKLKSGQTQKCLSGKSNNYSCMIR
jgi:hypothetical protein